MCSGVKGITAQISDGRERGDNGGKVVNQPIRACRGDIFLDDELDGIGKVLEQAEWTDAVGTDAILHAGGDFTLQPDQNDDQHQREQRYQHHADQGLR